MAYNNDNNDDNNIYSNFGFDLNSLPTTKTPSVCLHLSLAPCCPWPCTIANDDDKEPTQKRKLVQQEISVSRKRTKKTYNDGDVPRNWEIKKVLTESDTIGVTCRLLLGKKHAEELVVPVLGGADDAENGIEVKIWDVDTSSMYYLVFKRCMSGSYGFSRNWSKDFVVRRSLRTGDMIGLHWDQHKKCFDFSILKANYDDKLHGSNLF